MKVKTSELNGAALNWAVAKCEGYTEYDNDLLDLNYSTNWSQCGPIIGRNRIELKPTFHGWAAYIGNTFYAVSTTALQAAMLVYVASKLGDVVDIPEELV